MNTRAAFRTFSPGLEIDRSVLIGMGLSLALIGVAIAGSGQSLNFIDWRGLVIVLGGTLGATLAQFSMRDVSAAWRATRRVLSTEPVTALERIDQLVRYANAIRVNGAMFLEREARETNDPFLRMALELTVDGQSADDVKRILETDMRTNAERATRAVQVFESLGSYSPALGLIGTLVGLIQMLGQLDNPATVGPAMSVALVATLYGAVLANLVFLPIAGKLRLRNEEEWLVKSLTIEGTISLVKQENPIIVEQRLASFLPDQHA